MEKYIIVDHAICCAGTTLTENTKLHMPTGLYAVVAWMIVNIAVFLLLIPGDQQDLNNYIELILLAASVAGLFTMKKAGAALATAVSCIAIGNSTGNVLLAYYSNLMTEPVAYINALRIVLNVVAVVYLFRQLFAGKFR